MTTSPRKIAMRTIAATTLGMAALSFSSVSLADGHASSMLDGWRGTATLGANTSTGNSETSNINGSIRLGKTVNRWEHLVFGSVFKGKSAIIVTEDDANGQPVSRIVRGDNSNRIALGYQPKYYYNDRTYFFGILDWEQDKPANIDQGTRQIIGVGHRFFSDATGYLSAEVGIGNKNTTVVTGDDIAGGIGYLGVNYLNRFNENTTFTADLRSDFGSDNTFVEFGLGLGFRVSDNMSFKISHFSRNNSDLSSGGLTNPLASSSDSVTNFALVVDI